MFLCAQLLSRVQFFVIQWTVAHQAHGIFQARILVWFAISFSRGSSQPRDQTHVSCIYCVGRQILYQWHHLLVLCVFCTAYIFNAKVNSESGSVMSDSLQPMDYTLLGILQARIMEWVVIPFSWGSSQPRD